MNGRTLVDPGNLRAHLYLDIDGVKASWRAASSGRRVHNVNRYRRLLGHVNGYSELTRSLLSHCCSISRRITSLEVICYLAESVGARSVGKTVFRQICRI